MTAGMVDGPDGNDHEAEGAEAPEGEVWDADRDGPYIREEWLRVLVPALALLAVVLMLTVAWYLLSDAGPTGTSLDDVDEEGSFNIVGHWTGDATAYGPHAHAINLTLEVGDVLSLGYTASGPPDGIQVRLQHPLRPADGANGTGGTTVFSSSAGANGSLDLFVQESGAYQVYFWHPGSVRAPGEGDDPGDHVTASVSYRLTVTRAHRP